MSDEATRTHFSGVQPADGGPGGDDALPPVLRGVGKTHPGMVRKQNEDNFLERPEAGLWMVADGVGGAHAGDWASAQIVEVLKDIPPGGGAPELLALAVSRLEEANRRMVKRAEERGGGMIASTVVVLLARGWHYTCVWAGDSRCYLLRDNALTQITHDHSEVQELIDAGALTPEEAERYPRSNVITRALGVGLQIQFDRVAGRLRPGDRFVLCTDGLSKMLSDAEIATLMTDGDFAALPGSLVAAALSAGGHDNVTVVTVACDAGDGGPSIPWRPPADDEPS
ncbi:MAG: serine/threonine-protein phosphatase [Rhodospirillales bacterium]|nr:MAG: serine/threonine-protein phosphatase [Rhodospirillales bacterium]